MSSHPSTQSPRMPARAWAVLLVLCGAIFLEGIDVSMMGVALPSIRADLGLSTSELQWVVSAYVLGYGGFVLLGGRAADLLGRRRMFVVWLAVFLVFSGLGGLATEGWMLIVARFVTGVAAAFMTPAGLSIITTSSPRASSATRRCSSTPGSRRPASRSAWWSAACSPASDWRWVFFAPVVMAALLLPAALSGPPAGRGPAAQARRTVFDLAGAITLTGAMMLLVVTVVRAPDVPAGADLDHARRPRRAAADRASWPSSAVSRGTAGPPRHPAQAALVRANLGARCCWSASFIGFQFIAVLYLQELRHWSRAARPGWP